MAFNTHTTHYICNTQHITYTCKHTSLRNFVCSEMRAASAPFCCRLSSKSNFPCICAQQQQNEHTNNFKLLEVFVTVCGVEVAMIKNRCCVLSVEVVAKPIQTQQTRRVRMLRLLHLACISPDGNARFAIVIVVRRWTATTPCTVWTAA